MDETRFLELYHETLSPLYRGVLRDAGGDAALAEDVVQECYLRAVDRWTREGEPRRPLAWLRKVARNLLANLARSAGVERIDPAAALELLGEGERGATGPVAGSDGPSAEARLALQRGLAGLPPDRAELLEAFHLGGRSIRDLADERGLTERAVEGRLRRGREELRRRLAPMLDAAPPAAGLAADPGRPNAGANERRRT